MPDMKARAGRIFFLSDETCVALTLLQILIQIPVAVVVNRMAQTPDHALHGNPLMNLVGTIGALVFTEQTQMCFTGRSAESEPLAHKKMPERDAKPCFSG